MNHNFYGNYPQIMDDKNRIIVPQKFRQSLGNPITIMRGTGQEKHVRLVSAQRWEEFCVKADGIDEDEKPDEYRKMSVIMNTSFDASVDSQGRVTLPLDLREFAGLDKEVVVAGGGRYIEIWDKEVFNRRVNG